MVRCPLYVITKVGTLVEVTMSYEGEPFRSISVRKEVRDRVRSLKRGGESYTDLLDRMAEQYQPPESGKEEL